MLDQLDDVCCCCCSGSDFIIVEVASEGGRAERVKVPREEPILTVVAQLEDVAGSALFCFGSTEALSVMVVRGSAVGVEPSARGRVVVNVLSPLMINSTVGATSISVVVE